MPSIRAGLPLVPSGPLFPTFDDKAQAKILEKLVPPKEQATEAAKAAAEPAKQEAAGISYDEFAKTELKVGVVKTCVKVPKKDKLLELTVDIGEPEPRKIVAGLALSFTPEQLVGRKVVVVANLAPRDFGKGLISHGMLLATGPSEKLILATVDGDAAPGSRLK
jgi:methionyl-tRNA synthetase